MFLSTQQLSPSLQTLSYGQCCCSTLIRTPWRKLYSNSKMSKLVYRGIVLTVNLPVKTLENLQASRAEHYLDRILIMSQNEKLGQSIYRVLGSWLGRFKVSLVTWKLVEIEQNFFVIIKIILDWQRQRGRGLEASLDEQAVSLILSFPVTDFLFFHKQAFP